MISVDSFAIIATITITTTTTTIKITAYPSWDVPVAAASQTTALNKSVSFAPSCPPQRLETKTGVRDNKSYASQSNDAQRISVHVSDFTAPETVEKTEDKHHTQKKVLPGDFLCDSEICATAVEVGTACWAVRIVTRTCMQATGSRLEQTPADRARTLTVTVVFSMLV
ncbi:hypothetical protein PoB_005451900 [Plakobranchus ocellatus]|uniref:Uncharacterized protein n=1 Tax=Plakobranchus ocellatus TaxID=259542 RepID=A0AAV4CAD9_9GAST|nr:hypothetical protein PoB_005451900 [Plakobranchus ocellatus]